MSDDPFEPVPGRVDTLGDGVRRIVAPNASPMTFKGTNTYIVGTDSLVVIDPGPEDSQHLFAILAALDGKPVTQICATHAHSDHSPLAASLAKETGAPIVAFGDHKAGQSAVMRRLMADGYTGGGEGIDANFKPHIYLGDEEILASGAGPIRAIHTPGHMGNHLCFAWEDVIFSGDHVMGWASSMVSPPDGDISDFMASCRKLQGSGATVFYPGHGAPITDPEGRLAWLIKHRSERNAQILDHLAKGPADIATLTGDIYADVPRNLHPAAARNVFAHLIGLHETGHVVATPSLSPTATFARKPSP